MRKLMACLQCWNPVPLKWTCGRRGTTRFRTTQAARFYEDRGRRSATMSACRNLQGGDVPVREPLGDGPGRNWLAETVALQRVHAGGAQEELLLGGLDAFRRHLHAEAATERHDRVHDGSCVGRGLDRAHERSIDLDPVEWEAAQIVQARIAGAEIVEREAHTERLEAQHGLFGLIDIAKQR